MLNGEPTARGTMKNKPFAVLALALLCALNFPLSTSLAQDITATVAPNIGGSDNYVDIQNTNSGRWYFYSNPTPAAATMSRFSGLSEFPWPTSTGNFAPDPGTYVQDRIFQSEHLRVYPKTLAVGTLIQIAYATAPLGTQYHFNITVTSFSQVTSLNILDASPTSAATAHTWTSELLNCSPAILTTTAWWT